MALPKLEVPTFETQLPSSKKVVKYRPFLVKEHKILLMLAEGSASDITKVVVDLVNACTFGKIKADELAFFDLVHLFVLLRKASIGEMLQLNVNCECGNQIEYTANLNDVKVDLNPKHEARIRLNRQIAIDMRYPVLAESIEAYSQAGQEVDLAIACIKGIHEGNEYHDVRENSADELRAFIEDMNSAQFEKIRDFFITMPKISLPVNTQCPKCNKVHDLAIEGLDHFFV